MNINMKYEYDGFEKLDEKMFEDTFWIDWFVSDELESLQKKF